MSGEMRATLWSFAPMIYGPAMLYALGQGALIPLIPALAANLGANLAVSALVASTLVLGQLCGNLPASAFVARFGERIAMITASIIGTGGIVLLITANHVASLALGVFIIGMCAATFGLARHSFMTTRVPVHFRARALALLGGSFRLGIFIGPFVSAALLLATGTESSAVWVFLGCMLCIFVLVTFGPDPEREIVGVHEGGPGTLGDLPGSAPRIIDTGEAITGPIQMPDPEKLGIFRTMWAFRGVLARLGLSAATLSAERSARLIVLPLWGMSLGLESSTVSLVVGISGALDFALFYTSGQVMDRFGRIWAAVPPMLLMGSAFIALSFTHDVAGAVAWYVALSAIIGIGNGFSSGLLLTLAADLAPKHDPAPFLGSWRTLTDAGGGIVPLIFSGLSGLVGISLATAFVGVVGLLGAAGFARWIPRLVGK